MSDQKQIRVKLFERIVQHLLLVEDLKMKIVEDLEGIHQFLLKLTILNVKKICFYDV